LPQLTIDIFSDPICPWCMIGKHRLDRAMRQMLDSSVTFSPSIRWHIFQLNPHMPADGMDRSAYLAMKYGGIDRAGEIYHIIAGEGLAEGIAFAFNRISRTPNTLRAHALIRLAAKIGRASEMSERLFGAYFLEGLDIGETNVLKGLAAETGLSVGDVDPYLADERIIEDLQYEDAAARGKGISGVPHFVIDDRYSLSGAAAPEVLARAMELAAQSAL